MIRPDAVSPGSDSTAGEAPSARYLYCVIARHKENASTLAGIDDRPVYPVSAGRLSALVHDCAPRPYQGDDETVKRWVAAHAAVVEAAWKRAGSVLPMSFDVIVRPGAGRTAEENLRAWLERNEERFSAALAGFEHKVELGVQVLWDADEIARGISAGNQRIAQLQREMAAKSAGAAYFCRQKIAHALREAMEAKADADYRAYYQRIGAYADDIVVNKVKSQQDRQMLLHLSLLVARGKVSALGAELAAVAAQEGLEVRFTGPWPPYSFAAKVAATGDDRRRGQVEVEHTDKS